MPLYEYECNSCHDIVEVLVRHDQEQPACPACGDEELTRVLSVPAAPAISGGNRLPVAGSDQSCGAPRCCGGGCQI